ncbi:MAG: ASKHA domain-containing protein [Chitinophagales bacterium]
MKLAFVDAAGKEIARGEVAGGETIWAAARRLGLPLPLPCGGQGLCGRCRVEVAPAPPPEAAETACLSVADLARGVRLACRCRPAEEATVRLLGDGTAAISTPAAAGEGYPEWVPAGPGGSGFGVAIDLGTTTLVAGCVDLATGQVRGLAQAANPQSRHGDDLMTRLGYALTGPAALAELQRLAREAAGGATREACARAGVRPEDLRAAVVAGNPGMQHLFLGLAVERLARAPHQPALRGSLTLPAAAAGLPLAPEAAVYFPPPAGGFVGGDAVAAAAAEGFFTDSQGAPRLLVDLGTNGEVLLSAGGRVYACSTAAGPAFEGGRLSCGVRAQPGAVVALAPGRPWRAQTVDGAPARGLAGSGALAAAALLVATGALAPSGRLAGPGEAARLATWPGLAERLTVLPDGERAAVIVPAGEGEGPAPVLLTQRDIRQLQLAKGAVRAGVETLLARAGLAAGDLEEVRLAGAFGQGLSAEVALATGLLPSVPAARIKPAGNAAWRGAARLLADPALRAPVEAAAREVVHVGLAGDMQFDAAYLHNLDFPPPPEVVK